MLGIGTSELYFLVLINIFSLIIFNSSKFPRYFFILLLTTFSYSYVDMADYIGYSEMYEAPSGNLSGLEFLERTDIGFKSLIYLGNYCHFNFEYFKAMIYLIFGILLIRGLMKISNRSTNLVLSLYIVYPFLLDVVQIRHYMAMAAFIYAISLFLESLRKNEITTKSFVYFIPSVLFHISFLFLLAIIFVSYLLLRYMNNKNFVLKNIYLLWFSILIVSLFLILLNVTNLTYFATKTSLSTIVFYFIIYFLYYFLFIRIRSKLSFIEYIDFDFVLITATLLIGTTLPMLFFHVEFFRFFRVEILVLLSLMLSICIKLKTLIGRFYIALIFMLHISLSIIIFYTYYLENLLLPILFMKR